MNKSKDSQVTSKVQKEGIRNSTKSTTIMKQSSKQLKPVSVLTSRRKSTFLAVPKLSSSKDSSREASNQPSKKTSTINVLPRTKNSNGTIGKSSTNLPIAELGDGETKSGSVYDKYKQQFSKLANNKDIVLKESEEETIVGGKKAKLTPMPQYQKKIDSSISKDAFTKVERSAVMMRRMEYNAKMKKKKKVKLIA